MSPPESPSGTRGRNLHRTTILTEPDDSRKNRARKRSSPPSDFRFYVHRPATILGAVERAGLRVAHSERNWVSLVTVFTRVD